MPRATGLTQRKANYEKHRRFRETGICIQCESEPATTNQDGTQSLRCVACKAKQTPRRSLYLPTSKQRNRPVIKPRKVDEWGMEDDYGYLDTPAFAVYCTRVRTLITRSKTPMSIGDMKRAMGEAFSDRMHMDALDAIGDTIERFQSGAMSRYRPVVRTVSSVRGFDRSLSFNKGTPRPDNYSDWQTA